MSSSQTISELLTARATGDQVTVTRLFPAFYNELRLLAHRRLSPRDKRGRGGLDTTALVHEAYLKFVGRESSVASRGHFFALAARAMRQIIIDDARAHLRGKRGGNARHVTLDDQVISIDEEADHLLGLDEAITRLESIDERLARIVECRFFAGLTEAETADALELSLRTVQRDWQRARGWLRVELQR